MTTTIEQVTQDVVSFAQKIETEAVAVAADAAAIFKALFTPQSEQAIVTVAEDVAGVIGAIEAAQAAGQTSLVAVITAAFKYLADRQSTTVHAAPEADQGTGGQAN